MIYVFTTDNEHGRSLIELIRSIRACRDCFPQLYITCATHRAELDRIFPEACPDPECPACKPPAAPACTCDHGPDCPCSLPPGAHHYYCPAWTPRPRPTGVHDNCDYRV